MTGPSAMAKIQWSGRNHHFSDVTLSHPHGDTVLNLNVKKQQLGNATKTPETGRNGR